jgi:hypothetical protein
MSITHSFVGCSIAVLVSDPIISAPLILTSHWLLDLIPHWDFGTDWKKRSVKQTGFLAIADTCIGLLISMILFHQLLPIHSIVLAVALSNLPDWIQSVWFICFAKNTTQSFLRNVFYKIYRVQETYLHTTDTFPHGVYTQLFTIFFFGVLVIGRI